MIFKKCIMSVFDLPPFHLTLTLPPFLRSPWFQCLCWYQMLNCFPNIWKVRFTCKYLHWSFTQNVNFIFLTVTLSHFKKKIFLAYASTYWRYQISRWVRFKGLPTSNNMYNSRVYNDFFFVIMIIIILCCYHITCIIRSGLKVAAADERKHVRST